MKIKEIEKKLKEASSAYYNTGETIMSDKEYDELLALYISIGGQDTIIGADVDAAKVTHEFKLYSLKKATTENEVSYFVNKALDINKNIDFLVMDKFDGLTISATYKKDLVGLATRGNGYVGQNIFDKHKCITNLPNKIENGDKINVYGEAIMLKSTMECLNENGYEFKNTRNAAAGTLNLGDIDEAISRPLNSFIYGVNPYSTFKSYSDMLLFLSKQGFNIPNYKLCKTSKEIMEEINRIKNSRDVYNYDIDGVVISVNQSSVRDQLGYTEKVPKWAIAYKFEQEGVWTKLIRIRHQVGRTGKATPVADFEPIEILGAEVSKASLHNQGVLESFELDTMYVLEDGMGEDIYVKVIKANEIIPQIIDVRFNNKDIAHKVRLKEISHCPECGSELIKENDQHFCINKSCPAIVVGLLAHMAKRDAFNIVGLSEETAKKLVDYKRAQIKTVLTQIANAEETILEDSFDDEYYKKQEEFKNDLEKQLKYMHPSFIFGLSLTDIEKALGLSGKTKKSAENLYKAIEKSKTVDFDKFLYATGIPLLGRSVSKLIVEHYKTVVNFLNDNIEFKELESINGIGKEIIKSLVENYSTMLLPYGEIIDLKIIEPQIVEVQGGKDLKIVITGKFEISRGEIKTLIEGLGSKVVGSISSATNILLASPGEESTTKYKKAKELGIEIVNSISELKNRI